MNFEGIQQFLGIRWNSEFLGIRGNSALLCFVPRGELMAEAREFNFSKEFRSFGQGFQQTVVRVIRVWSSLPKSVKIDE